MKALLPILLGGAVGAGIGYALGKAAKPSFTTDEKTKFDAIAAYAGGSKGATLERASDGTTLFCSGSAGTMSCTDLSSTYKQIASATPATTSTSTSTSQSTNGLGGLKVPVFAKGSINDRPTYVIRPAKA